MDASQVSKKVLQVESWVEDKIFIDSIKRKSKKNPFRNRTDFIYYKLHIVEERSDWKIGNYTFETAPDSFYEWAKKLPKEKQNKTIKNYLEYKYWKPLCSEYFYMENYDSD